MNQPQLLLVLGFNHAIASGCCAVHHQIELTRRSWFHSKKPGCLRNEACLQLLKEYRDWYQGLHLTPVLRLCLGQNYVVHGGASTLSRCSVGTCYAIHMYGCVEEQQCMRVKNGNWAWNKLIVKSCCRNIAMVWWWCVVPQLCQLKQNR